MHVGWGSLGGGGAGVGVSIMGAVGVGREGLGGELGAQAEMEMEEEEEEFEEVDDAALAREVKRQVGGSHGAVHGQFCMDGVETGVRQQCCRYALYNACNRAMK